MYFKVTYIKYIMNFLLLVTLFTGCGNNKTNTANINTITAVDNNETNIVNDNTANPADDNETNATKNNTATPYDSNETNITDTNTTVFSDTIPPVITLLGDAEVNVTVGTSYKDAGAYANDDIDGNITNNIIVQNPVSISVIGTYTITYDVNDSAGNTAMQVIRTVNVLAVPTTTLKGTVTYDLVPVKDGKVELDYDNISQAKAKGVFVELIDDNNQVIAATSTDANGSYLFAGIHQSTYVKVRVSAKLFKTGTAPVWDFKVIDNTNSDSMYTMEGALASTGASRTQTRNLNAASGWEEEAYKGRRVAGPFAILGVVYNAIEKVKRAQPDAVFPPLLINWSVNNVPTDGDVTKGQIGTSFYSDSLYILGKEDSDSDEYDDHVIAHEWGHYYEDKFSRSDSIGGRHGDKDRLDIRVAFSEGFGNAVSGMIQDNPVYFDTFGDKQGFGWSMDLENERTTNPGWYSESSVQKILYDIYDSNDDGDDTLSLGFTAIHNIFIDKQKTTPAFTSIFTFIKYLKEARAADASKIDTIVSSESIAEIIDIYGSERTNLPDKNPYLNKTVDEGSSEICFENIYGTGNKLGNQKYIKLNISTEGNYSIIINNKNNSVGTFEIYQSSPFIKVGEYKGNGADYFLSSGKYLLDVYEYNEKEKCFDIEIKTSN